LPNDPINNADKIKLVQKTDPKKFNNNAAICRCGHRKNITFCNGKDARADLKDE